MSAGDETFKVTLAEFAAEKDAAKKAALKAKLDAEIAKRKAVEAAEAQKPKPLYPVGLAAEIAGKKAVIKSTAWINGTWVSTVEIDAGALIPNFTVTKPEAELKQLLAEQIGQPAGPAYPRGLVLYRNGQGGAVEDVKADGATYSYQIKGWPNRVSEAQLAAILGK